MRHVNESRNLEMFYHANADLKFRILTQRLYRVHFSFVLNHKRTISPSLLLLVAKLEMVRSLPAE